MSQIVQLQNNLGKKPEAANPDNTASPQSPSSGLDRIREELGALTGKKYWRSLEELADRDEFQKLVEREFPENASEWNDPAGRRKFLKLMGASLALAGLAGCTRQPTERIAPYVRQPEQITPGRPLYFATAMSMGGSAIGLLVESHEGRPTKIEGNGLHPAARVADDIIRSHNLDGEARGATDIFSQAAILSLYDPDRTQTLTYLGDINTWAGFLAEANRIRRALLLAQGGGQQNQPGQSQGQANQPAQQAGIADVEPATGHLAILTESVSSPTLAYQITGLMRDIPGTRWYMHEPAVGDAAREGSRMAMGRPVSAVYRFDQADIVLSLDSDFLSCGPASVRYSADFASRRRLDQQNAQTVRLYTVESSVTNTGAAADHRLSLKPSEIEAFARALAAKVGVAVGQATASEAVSRHQQFLNVLAEDLMAHRGRCVVVPGDCQPPQVHALSHALNQALGAAGATVTYIEPIEGGVGDNAVGTLAQLAQAIDAGQVYALLILGGNPVYTAPADLNFAERMRNIKHRIHLSLHTDETSEISHWNLPEAHFLESWSDAVAFDGTASIIQPLIAPIYSGKTAHEVLSAFTDNPERSSYDTVREYWMRRFAGGGAAPANPARIAQPNQPGGQASAAGQLGNQQTGPGQPFGSSQPATTGAAAVPAAAPTPTPEFEQFWRRALHDGVIPNTAAQAATAAPSPASLQAPTQPAPGGELEIIFRPDPTIYDGRFANNGWLQELPKPITTLTWDNVAMMSPATAARLGIGKQVNGVATNSEGYTGGVFSVDLVELEYKGRRVTAPAWIQPGHPDDCVTVTLGYGRRVAGRVGTGNGYNAYLLRTSDAPWFGTGLTLRKTGEAYPLAVVQQHHLLDDKEIGERDLLRSATLAEYQKNPTLGHQAPHAPGHEGGHPSLYPEWEYPGYAWGMAIDLNACTGCSACVVACVAENNTPVVGKDQVMRGREMQWLRIDSYFKGDLNNPETYFQPLPCMHCEQAPCEVVCPVAATVHSAEGLNDMVYNRCVGTRYCSNNCPYKVRRFNFLLYQDFYTASLKMLRNPDVSVRSRGVMEKCTYCVQRIQEGKIQAELRDERVRDKEIVTACAQACPTKAIVFGDINDESSEVYKMKHNPRNYALLDVLNTKPRTTYMGAVRNPNPKLEKA
jgi:molybdopterin-containing oxidoreductase family iron-sulfur binding subunit